MVRDIRRAVSEAAKAFDGLPFSTAEATRSDVPADNAIVELLRNPHEVRAVGQRAIRRLDDFE